MLNDRSGGVDAGRRVGWLYNTYADAVHTSGTNVDAAALQIAIWETLYDTAPDLTSGNFQLVTTGSIRDKATEYLTALYSGGPNGFFTSSAMFLDTTLGQDQVTNIPVAEPASLLLCGVGLATGALRRRNRRRTNATA